MNVYTKHILANSFRVFCLLLSCWLFGRGLKYEVSNPLPCIYFDLKFSKIFILFCPCPLTMFIFVRCLLWSRTLRLFVAVTVKVCVSCWFEESLSCFWTVINHMLSYVLVWSLVHWVSVLLKLSQALDHDILNVLFGINFGLIKLSDQTNSMLCCERTFLFTATMSVFYVQWPCKYLFRGCNLLIANFNSKTRKIYNRL